MSEYGPGLTLGQAFNLDKERIKHALRGELVCGEDENGFKYIKNTKEACEEYILSAFDNAVHHALKANTAARALEKIAGEVDFKKYMEAEAEEEAKYNDYVYEVKKDE